MRGRALHRVGRLLHLAGGLAARSGRFCSRDSRLELARRFLGLLRQRALQIAAARVRRRLAAGQLPLPLQLLLLPPRQLAQLLGQLVDLLIGVLLHRLLVGLVLVGHLVQFELEQVGQILGNRAGAATAATAAGVAVGLHLQLVFFFGLLQELERLVLRRQRRFGLLRLQVALGRLHLAPRPAAAARRSS